MLYYNRNKVVLQIKHDPAKNVTWTYQARETIQA
jgi:hypothetical protein